MFRNLGYENVCQADHTADEGRDVIMEEVVDGTRRAIIIECKHTGTVGRPVVQKLHSAIATFDFDGPKRGMVVTTGRFPNPAQEYAQRLQQNDDLRRNSGDDEDPFGGAFDGIEDLLTGVTGAHEAPVDVHEYDDEIRVVADLSDVTVEDIKIRCDGRTVAIYTAVEPRPFVTRVDLPSYVNDQSTQWSLNNGILEITLDLDTDPANIGFH